MLGQKLMRPGALLVAALALSVTCKRSASTHAGTGGAAGGTGGGGMGRAGANGGGSGLGGVGGPGDTSGSGGTTSGMWKPVPGVAPCVLEAADPAQVAVVPFTWVACGPGCFTTQTKVLASDDTVFNTTATARAYGDEVHVRFSTMWSEHYQMNAVRRLSDGALLAAVRAPGKTSVQAACGPLGFAPSAPHVLGFQRSDSTQTGGPGTTIVGFFKSGSLIWGPPATGLSTIQTSVLENDLGWGLGLYDGTLRLMIPPDVGPLVTVDQGAIYPAHSAVGRGSLVVSNPALPGNLDEVIRAWEPDRPSRTIVAQTDTDITAVALSDTTMAWVGVHGPGRADGTYTTAELYWSSFPAGKDSVSIMGGVTLAGVHGFQEIQTWGDYAVTMGYPDGAAHASLFVIRFSDGRLRTIRPRPGSVFVRLLAVSQAEIVTGENDDTGDPSLSWQMQHLTRYQLARLDDLAAAW